MLNFEDLEELKIQALVNHSAHNYALHYFADLSQALSSSEAHHFIIRESANSNIVAFSYILLSQVFEASISDSQQSSSNGSPNSQANSGSGSIQLEGPQPLLNNWPKSKEKEESNDHGARLQKIYEFLFSQRIKLCQIVNMPRSLGLALRKSVRKTGAIAQNMYLKKLLMQFLQQLQQISNQKKQSTPKFQQTSKQSIVYQLFRRYPVCQALFSIFIRCVLCTQYEIPEAMDFDNPISDQTVYTALCDAFLYGSLHIEENHTEISTGHLIRVIRLKSKHKQGGAYLWVSTPQYKMENAPAKEVFGCDTFRVRKKSSDVSSNNQSISFRQTSKAFHNQQMHQQQLSIQNRNLNKSQNISSSTSAPREEEKAKQKTATVQMSKINPELQSRKGESPQEQTQQLMKVKSENMMADTEQAKKLEKSLSDQVINISTQRREEERSKPGLNGYTSLEILKELNPKVRESMLNTITYFKKYHP